MSNPSYIPDKHPTLTSDRLQPDEKRKGVAEKAAALGALHEKALKKFHDWLRREQTTEAHYALRQRYYYWLKMVLHDETIPLVFAGYPPKTLLQAATKADDFIGASLILQTRRGRGLVNVREEAEYDGFEFVFTPLENAVQKRNLPMIQLLMMHGADPRLTCEEQNALQMAQKEIPESHPAKGQILDLLKDESKEQKEPT